MYVFTPHPNYNRPIYGRQRPYYGSPSPFAHEEPPYWLYSPAANDHNVNDGQYLPEAIEAENPTHWVINPALQQFQQKRKLYQPPASVPVASDKPTVFLINPEVQKHSVEEKKEQTGSSPPLTVDNPLMWFIDPTFYKLVNGQEIEKAEDAPFTSSTPEQLVHGTSCHKEGGDETNVDKFVAKLKLPEGTTVDDVKVRVSNNTLSVTGKKSEVTADSVALTTTFSRQWTLDDDVDTDNISAVIEQDGTLVVSAPKKPTVKEVAVLAARTAKKEPESGPSVSKIASILESVSEKKKEAAVSKKKDIRRSPSPPSAKKKNAHSHSIAAANISDPAFDLRITQNDNVNLVLAVQVPIGVSPNAINIEVKDRVLNITGVQHKETDGSVFTTTVERHFVLDERVETDKIAATFDADSRVLTVSAPKKPPLVKPPQKIAINLITANKEKTEMASVGASNAPVTPPSKSCNASGEKQESPHQFQDQRKDGHQAVANEASPENDSSGVRIVVQDQESSEGTKIIVETVADEE